MKSLVVGTKIEAYKSRCIANIIDSTTWTGEIVKVNKKSIKVRLNHMVTKSGKKVVSEFDYNNEITYRFSKVLSTGEMYYTSQSGLYGSIRL